jgi:hypothetical protein
MDDHGNGERHQAEKLGGGETDEQAALLAVGGSRVPQSALEERTENIADAGSGSANTDGGETCADDLG